MSTRRRSLGDVLHYFIPEEEQKEARRMRSAGRVAPARWGLISEPSRPLDRSLTADLAAALVEACGHAGVLAPFAGPDRRECLTWSLVSIPPRVEDPEGVLPLAEAIRESPGEGPLLVAVPPLWSASLASLLGEGDLTGFLVPVEPSPRGIREGLTRIRQLRKAAGWIGVFLVGERNPADGLGKLRQLEGAAQRQLGIRVEGLGTVIRDPASYRALLLEVPVLEVDRDSRSSQSLLALAKALLRVTSLPAQATP